MNNLMTKTMKTLAVAGMTMGLALGAQAAETVSSIKYIDENGVERTSGECTVVSQTDSEWEDGWYVVNSTLSITHTITVSEGVKLILMDGCSLTVQGYQSGAGIKVSDDGSSLAIYGQSAGTGKLEATGGTSDGTGGAGIGGGYNGAGQNITINGGTVTATGGFGSAGIGGGTIGAGQGITINGGTVTATGGTGAAGIGGGSGGNTSDITISANLVVKADASTTPPTTVISDGIKTSFATDLAGKRYVTVEPKSLPPVKVEVSAPDGATVAVYSNKVDAANSVPVDGTGTVLSNSIAYVVYTANESGKYFENGQTVVTNTLTTANDPATDRSAYVPTKTGTPKVQLGVVAQRYPWNGTIDVGYRAMYTPAGSPAKLTIAANGKEYSQDVTISSGTNTIEFTSIPAEIKAKGAKVTLELVK